MDYETFVGLVFNADRVRARRIVDASDAAAIAAGKLTIPPAWYPWLYPHSPHDAAAMRMEALAESLR